MSHLHIDFETYSERDLPEVGADNYAKHPSTIPQIAKAYETNQMPPLMLGMSPK